MRGILVWEEGKWEVNTSQRIRRPIQHAARVGGYARQERSDPYSLKALEVKF